MVNCLLLNLSQVKAFVHIVFTLLLLVTIVHALPSDIDKQQTNSVCRKCNNENKVLSSIFEHFERKPNGNIRYLCAIFQQFFRCVKPLERTCRPDLNFQTGKSVIRKHMKDYGCDSMRLSWNETLDIISGLKAQLKSNIEAKKECQRPKFKPIYKICGLFGDPHLRTFDDKRHTCSVPGAWPLFANRYLTVQVTNIPLENGSRATATSKVTVIVRGLKRKCIQQKTYQAKSYSLPAVFTDGTKSSDDKDCPTTVRQIHKGQLIHLDICPLKTKIIIRQVGKYLTVHMRVPKSFTRRKAIGLCQLGCPRIEQMNLDKIPRVNTLIASLYPKNTMSKRVKRQRRKRAQRLCRAANVTGFYYKSCMFDVLTSNDASFVRSARTAMDDFREINVNERGRPIVTETTRDNFTGTTERPRGQRTTSNRPTLRGPSSSSSTVHQISLLASFLTFVLLLLKTIR